MEAHPVGAPLRRKSVQQLIGFCMVCTVIVGLFAALPFFANSAPAHAASGVQINAGGPAVSPFSADMDFSGGGTASSSNTITTTGLNNPAPQAVYQTNRVGPSFSYTIPGLNAGSTYTVRLHFAETYWTKTGQRVFNVSINSQAVLSNFDIVAAAGGPNTAVIKEFSSVASSSGAITIQFSSVVDQAQINGIEVLGSAGVTPTPNGSSLQINSGGGAVSPFVADTDFSGGATASSGNTIDTSGVSNPAPQAVYQSNRYGNFTYTIPNLTANAAYTVNLHFAETYWTQTGQRTFNVSINGQQVLSNFDIIGAAGAANKAVVKSFSVTADGSGKLTIQFTTVKDNAQVNGIEVLGGSGSGVTPTPTATQPSTPVPTITPTQGTPNFGPNVIIFDPSMSSSSIQSTLDSIYSQQQTNQFGTNRYAILFKPGTYNNTVNVGFYTQVLGLGTVPDSVVINGAVNLDAAWMNGNATQNFWREAENMEIIPSGGWNKWAAAQASPMRRVDVRGNMLLWDGGWASGGFLADSNVTQQLQSGSQQQWFSRNDQVGTWSGGVWNMVFVGVNGAPAPSFPNPPETVVNQTPSIREKPFLYIDSSGNYNVFVPALRTNSQGTSWANGNPAGTSIPISQFYIAHPGDSAATINAALSQGFNLLLTPGVYSLNDTIRVTRANTVVLGLGMATLVPQNGVVPMTVADVDGVSIAGLLFDAGATNSPMLLQVGPSGSTANHSANPTVLSDVFFRIGGDGVGKATQSLVVNSNNVIGDDLWLWRADHGSGVGWTSNTAANGLVVNGNNVIMYGLAVEHYQQYEVLWNGNGGRTYFFQNEMPYDPPNQAAWMNGSTNGYAAYKVADSVTSHEAWGVGSYCYFNVDPSIVADRAFEVPNTSGVTFHDLVTVSLGGNGTISHIINNTGGPSNSSNNNAYLVSYP